MENVLKFIKKNKMAVVVAILVIVGAILLIVFKNDKKAETFNLSSVEQLKIREISNDIIPYLEEVEDNDSQEIDRYINFALEYAYDKENKDTLSLNELQDLVNSKFNVNVSEEQLETVGITPLMLDKSITFDMLNKSFHINKFKLSNQDIAALKIVTYIEEDMKKISNTEYSVTYKKVVVKNPYEILNYYTDLNNKSTAPKIDEETGEIIESNEEPKRYDTTEINKYLRGEEKVNTIKKYINKDNASKVGEVTSTIEVIYGVNEDKILVNQINK